MASISDNPRPAYVYDSTSGTWIPVGVGAHSHTPAAIGAVSSSVVTAKGDLIAATGNGTVTNVAVGADGTVPVANSSAVAGVSWAGPLFTAGKNKIINGDFGVWQRGTSSTTNDSFLADRFKHYWDGSGTFTVSQQTFTPGTAPVAGYEGTYFQRKTCNTVGTSTFIQSSQSIEDVRTFAGQTVTFSFWAKASASSTFSIIAYQNFGTGGSAAVLANNTTQAITTSWARYSATIAIPSIAGKTIGTGSNLQFILRSGTPSASATFDDWGWQVESGSIATPFTTATGTIQGELAACQRYYEKSYTLTDAPGTNTNNGWTQINGCSDVSNNLAFNIKFAVQKRNASYSAAFYRNSGTANVWDYAKSGTSGTATVYADLTSTSQFRAYVGVGGAFITCLTFGHWVVDNEL